MIKHAKKLFWAHGGNDHHPHFLRKNSLKALVAVAILVLSAGFLGRFAISNSNFLAAIEAAFLVDLANEERSDFGVRTLSLNPVLVEAAQLKANDMAANSYFAHTSPNGVDPWHWFEKAGYDFKYAGENLAVNFSESQRVHTAWLESPTHRANIVNYRFTEVGIAQAEGVYKGKSTIFVVQMFGRPDLTSVASASNAAPVVIVQNIPSTPTDIPAETSVQGQEAEVTEQFDEDYEIIELEAEPVTTEEPELFIIASRGGDDLTEEEAALEEDTAPQYTTPAERIAVSPGLVTQYILMTLAGLIVFAILIRLFVEIRRHHLKHVLWSVVVLAIVIVIIIVQKELILGSVILG
jgi:hypothetical protein